MFWELEKNYFWIFNEKELYSRVKLQKGPQKASSTQNYQVLYQLNSRLVFQQEKKKSGFNQARFSQRTLFYICPIPLLFPEKKLKLHPIYWVACTDLKMQPEMLENYIFTES